jgi:4,5-DOPA dioxygenase extradiol
MKRIDFLKLAALAPLTGFTMKLNYLNNLTHEFSATEKMPVLFLGHGSPMNAIEENEFVTGFRKIASEIAVPTAILCVSAHWETKGTFVTAMEKPRTIHDFGGFPKELFAVQYPAPGSPDLAKLTQQTVKKTNIQSDFSWGLDHGAWSVVKHLFPKADIPIIQMSIDYTQNPEYHYELAKELASLRKKGVLIIGSGNMVHNLQKVAWDKLNEENYAYDWAFEAKTKMNEFILNGNHNSLINYEKNGAAFQLAIPTPEHFLPLLYTLALKDKTDSIQLFNDKALGGSLTMTSVKIF